MTKLEDISTDQLKSRLETVNDAKAAKRLMIAIAYKDGEKVKTLAARYGIPQSTIYYWLDRFEGQSLAEALEDEPKPGRPPKLAPEQRAEVESWLEQAPASSDANEEEWTAERLKQRIREEFDIEYSVPHVHRTFL